jgi:hypothetical protein
VFSKLCMGCEREGIWRNPLVFSWHSFATEVPDLRWVSDDWAEKLSLHVKVPEATLRTPATTYGQACRAEQCVGKWTPF